jgi:hypothetical protein
LFLPDIETRINEQIQSSNEADDINYFCLFITQGVAAVLATTDARRDFWRGLALLILTFVVAFSWETIKNSKWIQNYR